MSIEVTSWSCDVFANVSDMPPISTRDGRLLSPNRVIIMWCRFATDPVWYHAIVYGQLLKEDGSLSKLHTYRRFQEEDDDLPEWLSAHASSMDWDKLTTKGAEK